MPRNTKTGAVLEKMVLPALTEGGYSYSTQVDIGKRLGGGSHKIDVLAENDSQKILISLKYQQVNGTAEQKVPFEVMCLAEARQEGNYHAAYIVLGGIGWKLREYYIGGGLKKHLIFADLVKVVDLENFVALANKGNI